MAQPSICVFWQQGNCTAGSSCSFLHSATPNGTEEPLIGSLEDEWGDEPLAEVPAEPSAPSAPSTTSIPPWKRAKVNGDHATGGQTSIAAPRPEPISGGNLFGGKTMICQFWKEGNCLSGSSCGFAHGEHELESGVNNSGGSGSSGELQTPGSNSQGFPQPSLGSAGTQPQAFNSASPDGDGSAFGNGPSSWGQGQRQSGPFSAAGQSTKSGPAPPPPSFGIQQTAHDEEVLLAAHGAFLQIQKGETLVEGSITKFDPRERVASIVSDKVYEACGQEATCDLGIIQCSKAGQGDSVLFFLSWSSTGDPECAGPVIRIAGRDCLALKGVVQKDGDKISVDCSVLHKLFQRDVPVINNGAATWLSHGQAVKFNARLNEAGLPITDKVEPCGGNYEPPPGEFSLPPASGKGNMKGNAQLSTQHWQPPPGPQQMHDMGMAGPGPQEPRPKFICPPGMAPPSQMGTGPQQRHHMGMAGPGQMGTGPMPPGPMMPGPMGGPSMSGAMGPPPGPMMGGGISKKMPSPTGEILTGVIKSFKPMENYGFVQCQALQQRYGSDAFCRGELIRDKNIGDTLTFELGMSDKGRPQVFNLVVPGAPPGGPRGPPQAAPQFPQAPDMAVPTTGPGGHKLTPGEISMAKWAKKGAERVRIGELVCDGKLRCSDADKGCGSIVSERVHKRCQHEVYVHMDALIPSCAAPGDTVLYFLHWSAKLQPQAAAPVFRIAGQNSLVLKGIFKASSSENATEIVGKIECVLFSEIFGMEVAVHKALAKDQKLDPGQLVAFNAQLAEDGMPHATAVKPCEADYDPEPGDLKQTRIAPNVAQLPGTKTPAVIEVQELAQSVQMCMMQNNNSPNTMGPNGMGPNAMGSNAMGPNAMGPNAMGPNAMGPNAMGPNAMGSNAMGPNAMGPNAMGSNAMGSNAMGPNAMDAGMFAGRRPTSTGQRYTGIIRTFNQVGNYGFIACDAIRGKYDKDVWCRGDLLVGRNIGETITFELGVNTKGQPQAMNVQPLDAAPQTKMLALTQGGGVAQGGGALGSSMNGGVAGAALQHQPLAPGKSKWDQGPQQAQQQMEEQKKMTAQQQMATQQQSTPQEQQMPPPQQQVASQQPQQRPQPSPEEQKKVEGLQRLQSMLLSTGKKVGRVVSYSADIGCGFLQYISSTEQVFFGVDQNQEIAKQAAPESGEGCLFELGQKKSGEACAVNVLLLRGSNAERMLQMSASFAPYTGILGTSEGQQQEQTQSQPQGQPQPQSQPQSQPEPQPQQQQLPVTQPQAGQQQDPKMQQRLLEQQILQQLPSQTQPQQQPPTQPETAPQYM